MKLIMENVRCFAGRHEIPIRPLTLLIGENSTGKTTVLASAAIVLDRLRFTLGARFNEPPFSLGSFDTIASYRGGRAGRARTFTLGMHSPSFRVEAGFEAEQGQPVVRSLKLWGEVESQEPDVRLERAEASYDVWLYGERMKPVDQSFWGIPVASALGMAEILLMLDVHQRRQPRGQGRSPALTALRLLEEEVWNLPVRATAPVRTKPRRTYDEFMEEYSPEGEHIPLVLRTKGQEEGFREELRVFGQESGLFSDVTVKPLGNRPGDPVQIMVQTEGPKANLIDVGYGVSQALPLVVESLRAPGPARFLVQQPEVHLHPRAQAALGSFLVRLINLQKHQFVIETHSDYIVDRVRLEIARGKIANTDVALLWFERTEGVTTVHEIQLDERGNVVDPPDSYRAFFLEEEMALLTKAEITA